MSSFISPPPSIERYSGLKKVVSDGFPASNVNINGVRGWNGSISGTAVIGEASGVAYSQTNNNSCWYYNAFGNYNKNRYVQCTVQCLAANIVAGVVLSVNSGNIKYHFMAYIKRTASGDDLYYAEQYGGASSVSGLIQSLATAGSARTITIRRSGRTAIIECTPGSVYYTRTIGGSVDLTDNDPAGLYYKSTNLFGFGNQATFDDFLVRLYPYE